MNTFKVFLLMGLMSAILVLIGGAIGGVYGALFFLLLSLGINFFSYFFSDKAAISMTNSRPVSEAAAPEYYRIMRQLTARAGMPMPKLYITPSHQPNAFATGRNPENSAIAVTEGLFRILKPDEITGVLAHELAHIKNKDVLIGSLAAAVAGAIAMISNVAQRGVLHSRGSRNNGAHMVLMLIMVLLAPIAATIIQMAISRSREYQADETGARLAGESRSLANALIKLDNFAPQFPMQLNPAVSHLFIVNPLTPTILTRLFSTHPPIEERVKRLKGMGL